MCSRDKNIILGQLAYFISENHTKKVKYNISTIELLLTIY